MGGGQGGEVKGLGVKEFFWFIFVFQKNRKKKQKQKGEKAGLFLKNCLEYLFKCVFCFLFIFVLLFLSEKHF